MRKRGDFYWYWFVNIPWVGGNTQKKLLERFGHPKNVFYAEEKEYRDLMNEKQIISMARTKTRENVDESLNRLLKSSIQFFHWESSEYPEGFRKLHLPPYGFYLKGKLPDAGRPAIAMVGSRQATRYGREMASRFAEYFAACGIQVVSGLAAGVDASGHRGALHGNGYTLGILGGGIDTIYPKNNFNLYMDMYEKGGVLSEYNMGIPNQAGLFPVRNRLISAVSDGVFVVEAGRKSGSLITADLALELGKDVFALPGRITDKLSEGCNKLIMEGAYMVRCPEDIVEILNEKYRIHQDKPELTGINNNREHLCKYFLETEEQKTIFGLLDEINPLSFNEILEKSGYNITDLQYILLEMELRGWIYQCAQNYYLKKL